jgi:hypothetical protein
MSLDAAVSSETAMLSATGGVGIESIIVTVVSSGFCAVQDRDACGVVDFIFRCHARNRPPREAMQAFV